MKIIKKLKSVFLQLLFPLRCPICDEIVKTRGEKICLGCMYKLELLTPPWCMKCGKKLWEEGEYCEDCLKRNHAFDRGRSLYQYGSVAPSVYRMKYGGRREYAAYFGEEMAWYLGGFIKEQKPDGIIPVPLHKKRFHKRGYNQAYLLAKALGECVNVPVYDNLILRKKNTLPLKYQNPTERQNNLKKAFIMTGNDVKLSRVLIVDDIYTTGCTVDEMAQLLKQNGVREVYVITLACGVGV